MRKCGECNLCCKLVPVASKLEGFPKPANQACVFQKHRKGCSVYGDIDKRPRECFIWGCGWLSGMEGTEDMQRPDRTGFVIDPSPDFMTIEDKSTGKCTDLPLVQIWIGQVEEKAKIPNSLKRFWNFWASKGYGVVSRIDERRAYLVYVYNGVFVFSFEKTTVMHTPEEKAKFMLSKLI